MPSRPVLALVIPAVSCIGQTLPCSGGRGAFNHVCSGLETIQTAPEPPFAHTVNGPWGGGNASWDQDFSRLATHCALR